MPPEKNQSAVALGKLGGQVTRIKHGLAHLSHAGKLGMAKRWAGHVKVSPLGKRGTLAPITPVAPVTPITPTSSNQPNPSLPAGYPGIPIIKLDPEPTPPIEPYKLEI